MSSQPSRKEITHQRIVETAARAIRRGGFQGVGVADIMKEAGLTHGGFYAHFASRDALLCEALATADAASAERVARAADAHRARGASALRALVEQYLSEAHLDGREHGCVVAALASEMPRQSRAVGRAAAQSVQALVATVRNVLPDKTAGAAPLIAGQMVGALLLARAFGDTAQGKRLLAATRRDLLSRYDTSAAR